MLLSTILSATLLTASLPLTTKASPAKTSKSDLGPGPASTSTSSSPASSSGNGPFTNARFTFYDVGLGACGKNNKASDFIVALNSKQYGSGYPGPNCFKDITITYKGKTHDATIMDECPGCPYGGLDFSRGLFDYFASEDLGVLTGEWSFKDGSSNSTSTGSGSSGGGDGSGGSDRDDGSGGGSGSGSVSGDGSGDPTSSGSSDPSSTIPDDSPTTSSSSRPTHSDCGHCRAHTAQSEGGLEFSRLVYSGRAWS